MPRSPTSFQFDWSSFLRFRCPLETCQRLLQSNSLHSCTTAFIEFKIWMDTAYPFASSGFWHHLHPVSERTSSYSKSQQHPSLATTEKPGVAFNPPHFTDVASGLRKQLWKSTSGSPFIQCHTLQIPFAIIRWSNFSWISNRIPSYYQWYSLV